MIKSKNGKVTLKGDVPRIMTDFLEVIRGVNEVLLENGLSKKDAENYIKDNVEIGLHPEKILEIMVRKFEESFTNLFGETEAEDEEKTDE